MSDEPQTWHYGLVGRWWAEFNVATPAELAFYRAIVDRYGPGRSARPCGGTARS